MNFYSKKKTFAMKFYSKSHFQCIFLLPLTKIMELEHLDDVHLGSLITVNKQIISDAKHFYLIVKHSGFLRTLRLNWIERK